MERLGLVKYGGSVPWLPKGTPITHCPICDTVVAVTGEHVRIQEHECPPPPMHARLEDRKNTRVVLTRFPNIAPARLPKRWRRST